MKKYIFLLILCISPLIKSEDTAQSKKSSLVEGLCRIGSTAKSFASIVGSATLGAFSRLYISEGISTPTRIAAAGLLSVVGITTAINLYKKKFKKVLTFNLPFLTAFASPQQTVSYASRAIISIL